MTQYTQSAELEEQDGAAGVRGSDDDEEEGSSVFCVGEKLSPPAEEDLACSS